jgi:hypothetical protein
MHEFFRIDHHHQDFQLLLLQQPNFLPAQFICIHQVAAPAAAFLRF